MADIIKKRGAAPEVAKESLKTAEKSGDSLKVDSAVDLGAFGIDTAESSEGGEGNSESGGERHEKKSDPSGGGSSQGKAQQQSATLFQFVPAGFRPIPSVRVMEKRIEKHIHTEIANLLHEVNKLQGQPYEQAEKLKEVRKLQRSLKDLAKMALEAIKEWYLKLFGKQHGIGLEEEEKAA